VSPRALEEIVRPRRLAGGGARPLNFTVRCHGSVAVSWIRTVRWILLYLYPPLVAVGWPALALYGALHPRLPDLDALHLRHGDVAIFIGSSATERSYIVIPRDLPHAAISRVDELGGAFTVTQHSVVLLDSAASRGHLAIVGGVRDAIRRRFRTPTPAG
jgi:hypothetical protein